MDCFICCDTKSIEKFFTCENRECNYVACIECIKKYLLDSSQDAHCMSCKNQIEYITFLNVFKKEWIFGKYKTHKENILINIEKSRFKEDMEEICLNNKITNINDMIAKEYTEYNAKIAPLRLQMRELRGTPTKQRESYISHFQCSDQTCNGFLDKDFLCQLCNTQTCKKCYVPLEEGESVKVHACNEEQIATFKEIKDHSKTCPSCGEFISKINGCDQMFCVKCGTSFSWKTGKIETGIVHNPHAHTFFQNNPQMAENYRNNVHGNNGCRAHLPSYALVHNKVNDTIKANVQALHRTVAEFRAYYRNTYSIKIESDITADINKHDRQRLLKKQIIENRFKSIIHMRYKKFNHNKQLATLIRSTFDIMELFFWELNKSSSTTNNLQIDRDNNDIIYASMQDLITDTNKNIRDITKLFGYTKIIILSKNMRGFPYTI